MSFNTVAIDVALLLPAEISAAATDLNRQLSPTLKFDTTHLPHLTVVQQFMEASKLAQAEQIIGTIVKELQPIHINVQGIGMDRFESTSVLYWVVEPSLQLKGLHNRVSADLARFVCEGNHDSFFSDNKQSIPDSTIAYVSNFDRKSSGDKFDPHITLGLGDVKLQQDPFAFRASHIAICQLGDLNTCRKVLHEEYF